MNTPSNSASRRDRLGNRASRLWFAGLSIAIVAFAAGFIWTDSLPNSTVRWMVSGGTGLAVGFMYNKYRDTSRR